MSISRILGQQLSVEAIDLPRFLIVDFASRPLTVSVVVKRYPFYHPSFLSAHLSVYLVGGVLAAWLISPLAESLGIEVVIWFILSASALVFVLLAVFFLESRLTAEAMALE